MKLAFIVPTSYLKRYATQGDIYLALAHLIDDEGENPYAVFHRQEAARGKHVILDNGLFEGAQVSAEQLLARASAIGAQTVCAPDALYDSQGTIKQFKKFIRAKQDAGLVFKVMGIPQADNPTDWWDCFRFMELSNDCDIIGLSILSIPKSFSKVSAYKGITDARMYVIKEICAYQSLLGRPVKLCHLLGLGETYGDVILSQRMLPNSIVSNDSSSAFVHGANEVRYSKLGNIPGGKISEKLQFEGGFNLSKDQNDAIQHNIKTALTIRSW